MSAISKSTLCNTSFSNRKKRTPGVFGWLLTLHAVWSERRALASMDQHRLDDLGLTRDEARREARRPTWDAPDRWLR